MEMERITTRQRAILTAVIESYIETGEPVGSNTIIARCTGHHSAASAPPQSATRWPSLPPKAFWNSHIPRQVEFPPRMRSGSMWKGLAGNARLLARLGTPPTALPYRIEFCRCVRDPGAARTHQPHACRRFQRRRCRDCRREGGDRLEHVHFSRLSPGRVLAVVVTQSGLVRDRVLSLGTDDAGRLRDISTRELEAAASFLNENFRAVEHRANPRRDRAHPGARTS